MPFRAYSVAKNGALAIPQVMSPNYVTGVSGWIIRKDGTAEFHGIVVPPGTSGNTIFTQGTAPTALNTGDLWVNTSANNEVSIWNGTSWVAYQWGTSAIANGAITTGLLAANAVTAAKIAANTITAAQIASGTITATQIAANTITAAQLAAGIVYAGIVDSTTVNAATFTGSTFKGTDFLINSSGEFYYNGSPCGSFSVSAVNHTSPTAGTVLSSFTATANTVGTYAVQWTVILSGTLSGTDANNFILVHNGSTIATSSNPGSAGSYVQSSIAVTLANGDTLQVKAEITGTTGSVYSASFNAFGNISRSIVPGTTSVTDPYGNIAYRGFCTYAYDNTSGGLGLIGVCQVDDGAFNIGTAAQISAGQGSSTPPAIWGLTSEGVGGEDTIIVSGMVNAATDVASSIELASQTASGVTNGLIAVSAGELLMITPTNTYTTWSTRSNAAGQTVSSTSFVTLTGMAVTLDIGTWFFRARVFLNANASAGQWQLEVTAPAGTSATSYSFKYESAAGVVALNVNRTTFATALGGPATSVSGAYWATIEGVTTLSAAGTLVVKGKTTVGADTFDVEPGSYFEAFPL